VQTNQMRAAPMIYFMLLTVTTPSLIGWHPRHSAENAQLQLSTRAWKLRTRRLLWLKGVLHLHGSLME